MARFLYQWQQRTATSHEWPSQADYLWVDLGPDDRGHIEEVVKHLYAAHPQVVRHVLREDSHRPNLLVEDDAVSFMLALIPTGQERPIHHLSFIIGESFLVTAHLQDESQVVDTALKNVLENETMDDGIDFVLYEVLTGHVEELKRLANHLDQEFERLHRKLLQHPYRDLSRDILTLRKRAMAAKHILDPESGVFELLKSPGFAYVQKKHRAYFHDVAFLLDEVVAEVQSVREGLAEMVEAYTSLQSNEINKVMWFLTIVSTLALPATTIASIYGMNWRYMPELYWRYGYYYVLGLMFFISVLLLLWMKIHRQQD